jgi:UPF0042 nucleotide-binding protein
LAPDGNIQAGIKRERQMLSGLKQRAHWVIETTNMNVHELRARIIESIVPQGTMGLIITLESFGYKYGTPLDADLVFDVRFLPNPNYDSKLKPLTGLNAEVKDYVINTQPGQLFFDRLIPLLDYLLPMYVAEGKSNLTIGIGCTGGRHRSVAIAEWLAKHYREQDYNVILRHRDVGKD